MMTAGKIAWPAALISLAISLRYAISLHSYSGAGKAPMYGDFEAQRHWMEITVNLPLGDWYRNTTDNNLMYWGLDYPPLTAYHSWLLGRIAEKWTPELVELHKSRGVENPRVKLFMRNTVVLSDLLLFFPGTFAAINNMYSNRPQAERRAAAAFVLNLPALLLIDHGHFQYNCVALGFLLWAIALYFQGRMLLCSAIFTCSLCFKQMTLYYAPAFFFAMLGQALHRCSSWRNLFLDLLAKGTVVFCTITACLSPFLLFGHSFENAHHILHRVFPFARGLYEDKVANFWCVSNVFYKWSVYHSQHSLVKLCTLVTIIFLVPIAFLNLKYRDRQTHVSFLLTLTSSSLAFFLFSYQVHEKSILLPLVPASLLCLYYPTFSKYFSHIASFSMMCLLRKDGLMVPLVALSLIGEVIATHVPQRQGHRGERFFHICFRISSLASVAIMLLFTLLPKSNRYPYLEDIVIASFSTLHFFGFYLFTVVEHFRLVQLKKVRIKTE